MIVLIIMDWICYKDDIMSLVEYIDIFKIFNNDSTLIDDSSYPLDGIIAWG